MKDLEGESLFFLTYQLILIAFPKSANKDEVESWTFETVERNKPNQHFFRSGRLSLRQTTSLVSLRLPDGKLRAAEYLQNQAVKFNSRVLFSMATRLSGADPMANVRKMLNSLITTLETESSEAVLAGVLERDEVLELPHKSQMVQVWT